MSQKSQLTNQSGDSLQTHICVVAQRAQVDGFSDVAAWMQKKLAEEIRESRTGKRRRGIRVKLARINREVVLDEARVKELASD